MQFTGQIYSGAVAQDNDGVAAGDSETFSP